MGTLQSLNCTGGLVFCGSAQTIMFKGPVTFFGLIPSCMHYSSNKHSRFETLHKMISNRKHTFLSNTITSILISCNSYFLKLN